MHQNGYLNWSAKKCLCYPSGIIKGEIYRFDIAESKYDNQNPLSPITFKGERFKVKKICF